MRRHVLGLGSRFNGTTSVQQLDCVLSDGDASTVVLQRSARAAAGCQGTGPPPESALRLSRPGGCKDAALLKLIAGRITLESGGRCFQLVRKLFPSHVTRTHDQSHGNAMAS
jgi:hypothetical protein